MKRYDLDWMQGRISEEPEGDYCKYTDVAALESQLREAQAENAALIADNAAALETIRHIMNIPITPGCECNESAGYICPRCKVFTTCHEALEKPHPGASLLAELEALRGVVIAAEELYYMATNIGDFRNGNSYNGIDEGEVMARKVFAKFETSLTAAKGGS